ncbi:hypothetical protein HRI_003508600 [Hibiscus trionum]|uniref:Uncharacterized protein n=1 Tax=Hibiscus trionum TaxID=183268 RepID=A0A9W7IQR4_HIBTR|nr:hypothetical protein HRI_003508600 [Hibiscus trionum]
MEFDDERVTKEDMERSLEEQYGWEEVSQINPGFSNSTKYLNAYMLVYIRESDKDKIIYNVDEKDIAEHLTIRCSLILQSMKQLPDGSVHMEANLFHFIDFFFVLVGFCLSTKKGD